MDILDLSRDDRLSIYRAINSTNVFNEFKTYERFADFLSAVSPDLHTRPSNDTRFRTLYEDIKQHAERNDDYSDDEVLLSKINILNPKIFESFLLELAKEEWYSLIPQLRDKVIRTINAELQTFNLLITQRIDNDGNYSPTIVKGESKFSTADVEKNNITIFIDPSPVYPSNNKNNHEEPDVYPALVLAYDRGWNDYNVHSQFDVFYHTSPEDAAYIGKTKIIVTDDILEKGNNRGRDSIYIIDYFNDLKFNYLPSSFCSLGQDKSFYYNLREAIEDEKATKSLLWAIKDVGVFPTLQEKFEKESLWGSLTRVDSAERMLRFAREAMDGIHIHHYDFTYNFHPPYSEKGTSIPVAFDFKSAPPVPSRMYVLIGKNGSGKTRLLSAIPQSLRWRNPEYFNGQIPRFGKIIAVSNSHYDNFDIPEGKADFNYVYCGLSEIVNDKRHAQSTESIITHIIENCNKANRRVKDLLKKGMSQISDEKLVDYIFACSDTEYYEGNKDSVRGLLRNLSSGETGLLYLFSSILTNIRYDSLILFDEPENHLHPNSIMLIVSLLYEILEKYDSYAIIATHSPIVVNAVRAENVLTVRRESNECNIRKIGMESLGANLSDLTEHVFGTLGLPLHYRKLIEELIEEGAKVEEIAEYLKSPDLELSFPVRLYLDMKIINQRKRQE